MDTLTNDDAKELFALILDEWITTQRVQGLSERTINDRRELLSWYWKHTGQSPIEITAKVAEVWLAERTNPNTRQHYYSILKVWGDWLVRRSYRTDNPMTFIPSPRRVTSDVQPVTRAHLEAVLSLPRLRWSSRAKIMLAAFAGLRVSEIGAIHANDYDMVEHVLYVRGKGGRRKRLPLHEALRPIAMAMPTSGYWFPSPNTKSGHTDGKTISRTIKNCFARAGIHMHSHQLRHYFASDLLAQGADVRVIQTLMRHSQLSTTAIYTAVDHDQQRAALQLLTIPGTATITAPCEPPQIERRGAR